MNLNFAHLLVNLKKLKKINLIIRLIEKERSRRRRRRDNENQQDNNKEIEFI